MTQLSVVPRASVSMAESLRDFEKAIQTAQMATEAEALWTELLALEKALMMLTNAALCRLHELEQV